MLANTQTDKQVSRHAYKDKEIAAIHFMKQ